MIWKKSFFEKPENSYVSFIQLGVVLKIVQRSIKIIRYIVNHIFP